jgi:hypothetical protein
MYQPAHPVGIPRFTARIMSAVPKLDKRSFCIDIMNFLHA